MCFECEESRRSLVYCFLLHVFSIWTKKIKASFIIAAILWGMEKRGGTSYLVLLNFGTNWGKSCKCHWDFWKGKSPKTKESISGVTIYQNLEKLLYIEIWKNWLARLDYQIWCHSKKCLRVSEQERRFHDHHNLVSISRTLSIW